MKIRSRFSGINILLILLSGLFINARLSNFDGFFSFSASLRENISIAADKSGFPLRSNRYCPRVQIKTNT